jgi:ferredoxin
MGDVMREYVISRDSNLLRLGRNVVAVKVVPPPRGVLLDLRLDEIHQPTVPGISGAIELSEKTVDHLAVVCDQCSTQYGQRPACVTVCPHDAALRVDARVNSPQ